MAILFCLKCCKKKKKKEKEAKNENKIEEEVEEQEEEKEEDKEEKKGENTKENEKMKEKNKAKDEQKEKKEKKQRKQSPSTTIFPLNINLNGTVDHNSKIIVNSNSSNSFNSCANFPMNNEEDQFHDAVDNLETPRGEAKFYLGGHWDQHLNIAPVIGQKMDVNKFRIEAGQPKRIWNANQSGNGPSKFNFSKLAIQMNEPEEFVAPTDSRNRPDQRLMENGNWDEANKIKNQLEDKQRKARKQAEADAERAMNNDQEPEE